MRTSNAAVSCTAVLVCVSITFTIKVLHADSESLGALAMWSIEEAIINAGAEDDLQTILLVLEDTSVGFKRCEAAAGPFANMDTTLLTGLSIRMLSVIKRAQQQQQHQGWPLKLKYASLSVLCTCNGSPFTLHLSRVTADCLFCGSRGCSSLRSRRKALSQSSIATASRFCLWFEADPACLHLHHLPKHHRCILSGSLLIFVGSVVMVFMLLPVYATATFSRWFDAVVK